MDANKRAAMQIANTYTIEHADDFLSALFEHCRAMRKGADDMVEIAKELDDELIRRNGGMGRFNVNWSHPKP